MDHDKLLKRLAELESLNDHLFSELQDLDNLMRSVGFTHGLATVKATALEISEGEKGGEDAA